MYRAIYSRNRRLLLFACVISLLLTIANSGQANGDDFKSEDELVDEIRANVERHLNDEKQASLRAIKEENATEEPKTVKELPIIN